MPLKREEEREKRFELMRERMRLAEEVSRAGLPRRGPPLTRERHERRERLKSVPAHLEFFRVDEVASMLGVSKRSVTRWFQDRAVSFGSERRGPIRPKKTLLISRQLLEQWLLEHSPRERRKAG